MCTEPLTLREQKIECVAQAITAKNAQPRTVRRFRRYAEEAVAALEAFEADPPPLVIDKRTPLDLETEGERHAD